MKYTKGYCWMLLLKHYAFGIDYVLHYYYISLIEYTIILLLIKNKQYARLFLFS